ncbi:ferredoxin [Saccharothrix violaceirubra]|uniref:Ferredoxin n=1 Tax=Saccharothrix violaceirubra TaxID=413306 RepID=A0A7W7WXY5_9PSEU|nr:ferredoxin [Saccharothrix violaceirubra]MBB4967924.1 ferredoxin [Saccharothrix violaceirubra]
MSDWIVEVDRSRCLGTGMCTNVAPDRFTRQEDGSAVPVDGRVEPGNGVLDAAESCPVEAILVRDSDGSVLAPQL